MQMVKADRFPEYLRCMMPHFCAEVKGSLFRARRYYSRKMIQTYSPGSTTLFKVFSNVKF